ncbi:hypothetical protein AAFF_G00308420 [Aldrovandia affinis]|uniref:C-type lectin domain-containing protein n=1 Tax=Aldrovandia affinis TaxID=143900 RepID=A0AAD7SNK0_9TELE|nr:hypothetical protein AAFF_G00308420 [Aldrovandia affinis]
MESCLSVIPADHLRHPPSTCLQPNTVHRMLRSALLILAVAGLHALPLPQPLSDDALSPLHPHAAVPVELRRQGTQPSRPYLVDIRSGLVQNEMSEMQRKVGPYYAPHTVDRFRQGTQNSRAVLVDLRSGLPWEPRDEMQRHMGKMYAPPSQNEFKQGTQNSRVVLVDPKTGLISEPIGEMSRSNVLQASRTQQVCQGNLINGRCYHFFPNAKTFSDAESFCRQLAPGGHLASVSSSDLHSRLVSMVKETNNGPVLTWLGGIQQAGKFHWIDGSSTDYNDWMPGQLEAHHGSEKCLEMFRMDESWWSASDCNLQRPFICSYPLSV